MCLSKQWLWHHNIFGLFFVRTFLYEQRRTHLIVSGALGLGDELGIADVTIALCEQASIHDARRLHLHLRLQKHTHTPATYANMNMIKMQNGIRCQWTLQCVLETHEHACISSQFRNSFLSEWQIHRDSSAQNMLILSVRTSSHGWFWLQSWKQWPEALAWVSSLYLAINCSIYICYIFKSFRNTEHAVRNKNTTFMALLII